MASIAQSLPNSNSRLTWLREWLKDELTPYPGRAILVARMVIASTLVMVICETFRIPYAWQAVIYALLVSRETPRATLQSAATIFLVTGIGVAYLLLSMRLFINSPSLHFVWIIVTLFVAFYTISAQSNYLAAIAFINTISVGIPLWDRHLPAETNVEDTLWLCLAVLIAVAVTAGVELAFARRRPADEVLLSVDERLCAIEDLFTSYAESRAVDSATEQKVIRLEMLGTSLLRRILQRSDYSPDYAATIASVAALVGRLVDLAATLTQLGFEWSPNHQKRFRALVLALGSIRTALMNHRIPARIQFASDEEPAGAAPLLNEIEHTVGLIPQAFTNPQSIAEYVPSPEHLPRPALLAPDAFVNPEHLRFALRGCLAASGSYVIYNSIDWPGISTAVTTCLLTALSTIGASRQKQVLRIAGAVAGGFVLGMGAQAFILPYVDSIAGFLVLFVLVTGLSSWFMTSSPRLSYFGVQVALAFYLVNLEEFKIRTSLAVARDRVAGILLGLFMMWLIFDRLGGAPAAVEIKKTFVSNLRSIAQLAREPLSNQMRVGIGRTLALRETINTNLDKVRALADGVLFEFGPSRQKNLEVRSRIRRLQPQLRTLFLMRIASLKYRLQLPGFELPDSVRLRQQAYDEVSARMLEEMADRIEGREPAIESDAEELHEALDRTLHEVDAEASRELPAAQTQSFVRLLREIDALTNSLAAKIATEFGGSS